MRHQGLGFFLLVLCVCAMEAWQGRSWPIIAVWLAVGLFVLAMDWPAGTRLHIGHRHSPR
jgi:hypothetical protein